MKTDLRKKPKFASCFFSDCQNNAVPSGLYAVDWEQVYDFPGRASTYHRICSQCSIEAMHDGYTVIAARLRDRIVRYARGKKFQLPDSPAWLQMAIRGRVEWANGYPTHFVWDELRANPEVQDYCQSCDIDLGKDKGHVFSESQMYQRHTVVLRWLHCDYCAYLRIADAVKGKRPKVEELKGFGLSGIESARQWLLEHRTAYEADCKANDLLARPLAVPA